jgi:hypothetical protein
LPVSFPIDQHAWVCQKQGSLGLPSLQSLLSIGLHTGTGMGMASHANASNSNQNQCIFNPSLRQVQASQRNSTNTLMNNQVIHEIRNQQMLQLLLAVEQDHSQKIRHYQELERQLQGKMWECSLVEQSIWPTPILSHGDSGSTPATLSSSQALYLSATAMPASSAPASFSQAQQQKAMVPSSASNQKSPEQHAKEGMRAKRLPFSSPSQQDSTAMLSNSIATTVASAAADESTTSRKKDSKWLETLEQLKRYKAEHGDCIVPRGYSSNPRLASWVAEQR